MFSSGIFLFLIWPAGIVAGGGSFSPPSVPDPHAGISAAINTLALEMKANTRLTKVPYLEGGFATAEAVDTIALTGEQTTTELTVTPSLPDSALLKKASVLTTVTALNNSANAQKIDITVQGRKASGSFTDYFSQDNIIGFGAVDGATSAILPISIVTALIDDLTAAYGFRCSINQSSANSVVYTIQHVLIINYALS